jgi:hypothetical protein
VEEVLEEPIVEDMPVEEGIDLNAAGESDETVVEETPDMALNSAAPLDAVS